MSGDGAAVKANKYHNLDPSISAPSICIIDGDSAQSDDPNENVYRLPGEAPELYVFDEICDKLDECSGILAVRFMRQFSDAKEIKDNIIKIGRTNHDAHLIYTQIGEAVGFVDENIIAGAFLSTWCEKYPEEVNKMLEQIKKYLPFVTASPTIE